jgi:hypothetical protein
VFDQEEMDARVAFQHDFLNLLRRHPEHGAAALYPVLVST